MGPVVADRCTGPYPPLKWHFPNWVGMMGLWLIQLVVLPCWLWLMIELFLV